MKKVRIVLTSLVLGLALTGVVVAKANEKKRVATDTVYFRNAANTAWYSITATGTFFDQVSGGTTAIIKSTNSGDVTLYYSQSTTDPAKFTRP